MNLRSVAASRQSAAILCHLPFAICHADGGALPKRRYDAAAQGPEFFPAWMR